MTPESHPAPEADLPPVLSGLIAAVATPLTAAGTLDVGALDRILPLLTNAGASGVCLGGATAEYPHTSRDERIALMRHTAQRLPDGVRLVVGIGAAAPRDVVPLGHAAFDAGATAVLLSMPLFFPYAQDDLETFCRDVAARVGGPVLLYDLPSFTTPLETATILTLLDEAPGIVGIKDSSGNRDRLTTLAEARGSKPWRLIVGDDNVLPEAMAAGWDGSISGVAGFCPELLVALTAAAARGDAVHTAALFGHLRDLITQISGLPTPWGIRLGLAARGIDTGALPLPLSPRRASQADAFGRWLPGWFARVADTLGQALLAR